MEEVTKIIEQIMSMNTVDAVLKIVMAILAAVSFFFFSRWRAKQAKIETEKKKKSDIEKIQNQNQSAEIKIDSQAIDDFLRRK